MISIITINRNNKHGLDKTLHSVFMQSCKTYEIIVIDGDSTDGSKDVIQRYAYTYQQLIWISEKDRGVYSAMNKGICRAKGEYIIFMNSGDCFHEESVLSQVEKFLKTSSADIIYGDVCLCDISGKCTIKRYPDLLSKAYLYDDSLCHQTTIVRKCLFHTIGLYDEQLQILSDWQWILQAILKFNCTYAHIDLIVADYDMNGISHNKVALFHKEKLMVQSKEFDKWFIIYMRVYRKVAKLLRKL